MEQFATTNSSSSSKRRPTTGPLRLSLQTSSVPRPNYNSFDQEWHLQSSPLLQQQQQQQQQHQQQYHHHGVGVSAPSNGYGTGATYSNFEGTSFQRKRERLASFKMIYMHPFKVIY